MALASVVVDLNWQGTIPSNDLTIRVILEPGISGFRASRRRSSLDHTSSRREGNDRSTWRELLTGTASSIANATLFIFTSYLVIPKIISVAWHISKFSGLLT